MTGIIFNIKRFAVHDGPGIRTTVFLKGCPLRCRWCHNPESWQAKPQQVIRKTNLDGREFCEPEMIGRPYSVKELVSELEKERIVMEESGGGVTFSGGEPLQQHTFLEEALSASKNSGFHTAVDTSGYDNEKVLEHIIPYTDLFLFDIKLMDDKLHKLYTGVSNQPVLESLRMLAAHNCRIHIRIPLINGITATRENIAAIAEEIDRFRQQVMSVDLLPYHRIGKAKYQKLNIPFPPESADYALGIQEQKEIATFFRENGFTVTSGNGNLP